MMRRYLSSGFTLIEVLIALALTAVAASMAYSGLDSAMKMTQAAEEESDRLHHISHVFSVMSRDFNQVVSRKVRAEDGFGYEPAFYFDESTKPMMKFSRAGWTNPQPERFQRSELQRVAYHYDGEKLLRYNWMVMDRYSDSKVREIELLDKVKTFNVRILLLNQLESQIQQAAGNTELPTPEKTWVDTWPPNPEAPGADSALPLAIEITLELEDWGEIKRIYELPGGLL